MTSRNARAICHRLIRRSTDLCRLYRHAAHVVHEPGLRALLGEDAQALEHVVLNLKDLILADGDQPPAQGHWRSALRCRLVDGFGHDEAHRDHAWIRALARDERVLMRAFEEAVAVLPDEQASVLQRQLPRLRIIHLDMHNMAGAGHS